MQKKTIPVAFNYNSSLNYQQANRTNDSRQYVMSNSQQATADVSSGTTNMRDDRNIIDDGLGHVNFLGRHSNSSDGYDDEDNEDDEDDGDNENEFEPDTVSESESDTVNEPGP